MSKFEDNLLHDLMGRHGPALAEVERPASRSASRPLWVTGGALAVAGAVAFAVTSFGGMSAAFAVTENADGSVTVSIQDIKAVDAANAKLRELGVRAKAVPMTSDCADLDGNEMYPGTVSALSMGKDGGVTISNDVPAGYTVLLGVSNRPDRGTGLAFAGPVNDPAPSCLLDQG